MSSRVVVFTILISMTSCTSNQPAGNEADRTSPNVRSTDVLHADDYLPNEVTESGHYRLTAEQKQRMARTPLDPEKFVRFIEKEWPLSSINEFCVERNIWPEGRQNLVFFKGCIKKSIHVGIDHGYDDMYVYVNDYSVTDTKMTSEMRKNWHRWAYSINFNRGGQWWVVIDDLPNDFMDRD